MERTTLERVSRHTQMSSSRATIREIDDKHLMQEIKKMDGFHSETFSNEGTSLERFQLVGLTSVPLKQFDEENQGSQQTNKANQSQAQDGFDHNQPKGKSAEALLVFVNGQRSHPIAFIDDRRVRPYNMKEGEAALYHASGTEQKMYLTDQGAFVIANNNPSEEKNAQQKDRFASLRHVELQKQKHEIKKGQEVQDHKHEGDSVNTEVRCTKDRIEFRVGDEVVGYYDKGGKKWNFNGNEIEHVAENKMSYRLSNPDQGRIETVGNTFLGLSEKDEKVPIGETDSTRYKRTYVKLA